MATLPVNIQIVKNDRTPTEEFIFYLQELEKSISSGGGGSDENTKYLAIFHKFNLDRKSAYQEIFYNINGQIEQIDVWNNATKSEKLYTETITYSGGKVTKVEIVDEINSITVSKSFTYSGDKITTITVGV